MYGFDIGDYYFGFQPVIEHAAGCRFIGTNMWEITQLHRDSSKLIDGSSHDTCTRMLCRECGVVRIDTAHGSVSTETGLLESIGYGTPPQRVAGLWLHAGPKWFDDDAGPKVYYLAATKTPPAERTDVVGCVEWILGQRGGQVWKAAYGQTYGKYGWCCLDNTDIDFRSKTAAAKWVAERHAAELVRAKGGAA